MAGDDVGITGESRELLRPREAKRRVRRARKITGGSGMDGERRVKGEGKV